jgi:hypothetical protein
MYGYVILLCRDNGQIENEPPRRVSASEATLSEATLSKAKMRRLEKL